MSLVEVLVSMALLLFASLSIVPVLLTGVFTSATSQEITELTVAAGDRLELLATYEFAATGLQAGGDLGSSDAGYSVDPFDGDSDRYLRWQIIDESAILKRIVIVAGERDSVVGPPREIRVETFRADIR